MYAEEAEEERERYRGKALAQNEKVYPRSFPLVRCAELFRFYWRDACQKSSVMRKKEAGGRGGASGLGEGGMRESERERVRERERKRERERVYARRERLPRFGARNANISYM